MIDSKKSTPVSPVEWIFELVAAAAVVIMLVLVAIYYRELPAVIPQHFDASGKPDATGNKAVLFVLPVITLFIYLALTLVVRYPNLFNYPYPITEENAHRQYTNTIAMLRVLKTVLVLMFLFITYSAIQTGLGVMSGIGIWFLPVSLLAVFGTVGFFLYRGYTLK